MRTIGLLNSLAYTWPRTYPETALNNNRQLDIYEHISIIGFNFFNQRFHSIKAVSKYLP